MGSKGNGGCWVEFNQHKLINKMVVKIWKIGDVGCYFCKVADGCWTCSSQAVRFSEDSGLVEPGKQVIVHAFEFDTTKALVAE